MKTYGDLINALIPVYEEAVKKLPKNDVERYRYLTRNFIQLGICSAIHNLYGIDLRHSEFIDKYTNGCMFLTHVPEYKDYDLALSALQQRLKRLNEILPAFKDRLIELN